MYTTYFTLSYTFIVFLPPPPIKGLSTHFAGVLRNKKLQGASWRYKGYLPSFRTSFFCFSFFFFLLLVFHSFSTHSPFHLPTYTPSPSPSLLSLSSHLLHNALIHQSRLIRRCRRRSLGRLGPFLRPCSGGCHLLRQENFGWQPLQGHWIPASHDAGRGTLPFCWYRSWEESHRNLRPWI